VYLAEDAVRILYDLGIGHRMKDIGHGICNPFTTVRFF